MTGRQALETDGLPKLKTIYGLFGAQDDVMGKHFRSSNNYNQVSRELMYNWFNQHLKLGMPTPVKEQPWKPVAPKELSVYDEQHPRPTDTADATSLRKYMTEASDRQLDELFKADPAEYRRTLRTALGVMVKRSTPRGRRTSVVVSQSSEQPSNEYAQTRDRHTQPPGCRRGVALHPDGAEGLGRHSCNLGGSGRLKEPGLQGFTE